MYQIFGNTIQFISPTEHKALLALAEAATNPEATTEELTGLTITAGRLFRVPNPTPSQRASLIRRAEHWASLPVTERGIYRREEAPIGTPVTSSSNSGGITGRIHRYCLPSADQPDNEYGDHLYVVLDPGQQAAAPGRWFSWGTLLPLTTTA
ncbi:hypothetical protein ACIQF5_21735 [Streptomyces goshikiensis]|uniref:hypothetical protein n=1 Tax=Streptomyces goshikiensis TaxID=1942 RepID=UPI0037FEE800